MSDVKISVILPIYNVEDYIEETLDCLLNQSMIDDMEVLMVDDGSTDSSRYIIEKYALDYDNFHAFHKNNEGSSITRNFGMKYAKGKYVSFLDPDDLIDFEGYEKLYKLAKRNDSDIVTSNFTKFGRYNSWKDVLSKKIFANIHSDMDSVTLDEMNELVWDTTPWGMLYKKDFLDRHNIRFPNKRMIYEDIPFTLRSYILAENISISYDIFYYWRVRKGDDLSQTQQIKNIRNFTDRIDSINLCREILKNECVGDTLRNALYEKWLNHDLFLFLKRFNQFPNQQLDCLLNKINDILDIIPSEIRDNLNSFKKITYLMVENYDIDGLNYLSSLHNEIMENPHIPSELDERYVEYIDFENDAAGEELTVKKDDLVDWDDNNIYITFMESINYLNKDYPHKMKASLIDSDNKKYHLNIDNNIIDVPIDLIKDISHANIKMEYVADNFKKETFLLNSKRQVVSYDGFDVEVGTQSNRIFCLDVRLTNSNEIKINEITFENGILNFTGTSFQEIDSACLQNVVTFKKFHYPVISNQEDDGFHIEFSIPHKDILRYPVDKWEIRVDKTFKSITIPRKFEFYTSNNKIRIINARNKILIENDLYNKLEKLSESYEEIYKLNDIKKDLTRKNKSLIKENKMLIKENTKLIKENNKVNRQNDNLSKKNTNLQNKNEDLNKLVEEYKSRFVVKSADKINKFINRTG